MSSNVSRQPSGIAFVSTMVKGRNQGTMSNDQGVFSIVVLKRRCDQFYQRRL